mgnify:CR=1 FL=1
MSERRKSALPKGRGAMPHIIALALSSDSDNQSNYSYDQLSYSYK